MPVRAEHIVNPAGATSAERCLAGPQAHKIAPLPKRKNMEGIVNLDLGYSHTQKSSLGLFVSAIAIVLFIVAFANHEESIILILGGTGIWMFLLGMAFHHLTVEDHGERLAIRFGPLPLFRRTVRYADIEMVEVGRTSILEGWGIHMRIRGGWVWNIWGRDCVVVQWKNGRTFRIGTDDAENLSRFLEGKIDLKKSIKESEDA